MAASFPGAVRGKTIVVTGASSGLGLETARILYLSGAHVILAVRDLRAGEDALRTLRASPASEVGCEAVGSAECMRLDLRSLQSVRDFAAAFSAGARPLHVLVNNAGVFQLEGATPDGLQTVFQVNALAPALLTELVLPAAAPDFRVVHVSSQLHFMAGARSLADRAPPPAAAGGAYSDYAYSKACQISHCTGLNARFAAAGAAERRSAYAVEPGLVRTSIMRESPPLLRALNYALAAPILKTVGQGAATVVYCVVAPGLKGGYYADCAPREPLAICRGEAEAARLHGKMEVLWAAVFAGGTSR